MTEQEINQAIAEACPDIIRYSNHLWRWQYYDGEAWLPCKDNSPSRDLNAIHEAEKVKFADSSLLFECYLDNLGLVVNPDYQGDNSYVELWQVCHTTARQRAEAFLRTVGKLKEDER